MNVKISAHLHNRGDRTIFSVKLHMWKEYVQHMEVIRMVCRLYIRNAEVRKCMMSLHCANISNTVRNTLVHVQPFLGSGSTSSL